MITSAHLGAQQLGSIAQMGSVNYFFNPAAIEIGELDLHDHIFETDMLYRQQWASFEGAPQTAILGVRYQNYEKRMSLSGFIAHDQFGLSTYNQIQIGYSYQLPLDRWGRSGLSMGLYFAGSQYRIDGSRIDVIEEADPLLSNAMQSKMFPSLGLGVFYYKKLDTYSTESILFAGISGEQVIPVDVRFEGLNGEQGNLKREPHFHTFAGFQKYYSVKDYFEPVLWVSKTFWSPLHLNGMIRATFLEQRMSFGAGLSSEFQYYFEVGFQMIPSFKINYGVSSFMRETMAQQTGMSHEIILSYQFMSGGFN
jgi:type IX secretion system PorP/SprF family membrane protein